MTEVKIKLNSGGIRALLSSLPVAAACAVVAHRIADRARSAGVMVEHEPGDIPIPVEVHVHIGARARAVVVLAHPAGAAVEVKHRLLGRSLDGGRI